MRNTDRRNWLKTVGLSSGFALMGGLNVLAFDPEPSPYITDQLVRLNANENPYGPSQRVRAVLTKTFDDACRYPFRTLPGLVEMIAEKEGVSKQHIVVTGGSTEGLTAAGLIYGMGGGEIIAADPTFQAMLRYAETHGAFVHRVPLNDKMEHDLPAMADRVNEKTRLIFICNPNNPTGTLLNRDALKDFCNAVSSPVMIFSDEAYYDFITEAAYPSMVELVKEGQNVIVSKTFSKVYGLAGLRVGYLVARPDIADRLKESVMANTNILAIEAAKEALKDDDFYKFSVLKNFEAKNRIYATLDDLGLEYIKSHTNFVFFKSGRQINDLIADMEKENILIGRPFPPMYDWARISTGTLEQVEMFGNALRKVIG
ncbi:MAG: histidinol-phosphate aminotransferase family protein [Maribacter sp.]|nr:histidinol-phosphate aminotransferase family protein [Maribacter sp.]